MRYAIIAVGLALGCGGVEPETKPGSNAKPAAQNDQYCDPAHPQAREYPDQQTAESAGCVVKRVYGAVKNKQTGQMMDNEIWVFCCPKQ
jgi:hypothetical protein